ncbi:MAG: RHS repeat domain-containing protein [Limisphaerales bacterium]
MNAAVNARLFPAKRARIHCVFLSLLLALFLAPWNSQAQSLSNTNQTVTTTNTTPPLPGGPLPPPPPPLVLTNPPPGNLPPFPSFSALPTTKEIINARVFDEPLIPCDGSPFSYGDDGNVRWLEATDPQGGTSRAEFNQSDDIGIPNSDPGPLVPRSSTGNFYTRNYILYGRNTFYWDKKAMAEAPGDYSKARLYHWLHNADLASAEGCLESVKEPLENRVWFNYPGQDSSSAGATIYGSQNLPSAVARVMDDGSTQLYQFYRNPLGKITNAIDPANLNFSFVYATNQMDLLQVRQTLGTNNELDASFTYNSQHLPLTAVDASGQTNRFAYNTYGQITGITNALSQVTAFNYDSAGRLLSIVGPTNTAATSFTYDSFDRVKTVTDPDGYGRIIDMYDGYGTTAFNYYPVTLPPTLGAGRLKTVVDPNGLDTFTYGYDAVGRIQSVVMTNTLIGGVFGSDVYRNTYTYDILGRVTQDATKAVGTFNFTYVGASSRLASIIYPASLTTTFGYYNTIGDLRLRGLTNSNGGTLLSRFNYAYNEEGQITNLLEQLGSGTPKTNQISYDAIGEVLAVTTNGNNGYTYAYDLAGNRTLETFGTNTWRARFNPLNEIQSKDQGLSSTNRAYQWDEENRLVSVTAGSVGAKMIYNGFGRLVYLTEENNGVPSMYHWYVWDGDKIAEESYINTNYSAYFHWHYDYGHYDSYVPSYVWTTRDGLGSPREMYSGQYSLLLMQYDYDPYGRQSTLVSSYSTPPDIGFTGMFGIPGHNLDFAENRVYDPDTGRWLSRDPIGEAGGLNFYSYALNDPIDNVDPSGLCPQLGTLLGEGQYRDVNGDIRDQNGDLLKDQLNPLNPINFEGGNSLLNDRVERFATISDRIRNVAQQGYNYAVQNPRMAGLNRSQLGIDAEVQATRWLRRWAERNNVDLGVGGLQFQVRGSHSIPDVVFDPAGQIFDFKLTPKAIRSSQTRNFQNDFPGYNINYIFGP